MQTEHQRDTEAGDVTETQNAVATSPRGREVGERHGTEDAEEETVEPSRPHRPN